MNKKYTNVSCLKTILLVLIFALFIGACSQLRLGYYFADWYFVDVIDDYFDLTSQQEDTLDKLADRTHQWHRKEEIPKIMVFMIELEKRFSKSISREDVNWMNSEIQNMKERITLKVADDIALFLTTLEDRQIRQYDEYTTEHEEHHAEDFKKPEEEWKEEQIDELFDDLEDWFGDFSDEQKVILTKAHNPSRATQLRHHQQTVELQKKFGVILRQRQSAESMNNTVTKWFLFPETMSSESYKVLNEREAEERIKFFITLDRTITTKQRKYLLSVIRSYYKDLEAIYNG